VLCIICLNDGLFPLSRAINSTDENELEEERRLMYVAITRAKERLYLTRAKTRFSFESKRTEYTVPSRFLNEAMERKQEQKEEKREPRFNYDDNYERDENIESRIDYSVSTKANIFGVNTNSFSSPKVTTNKPKKDYSLFKRGTKVKHPHFGIGEVTVEVTDFSAAFITIKFDTVGIKTLSLKYADLEIL